MSGVNKRSVLTTAAAAVVIAAGTVAITHAHSASSVAAPVAPVSPARTASASPSPGSVAGWNLVWKDDFTGPAMSLPDASKWGYYLGNGIKGWGNKELEYYTKSTSNVRLDGSGNLQIWVRKENKGKCWYGVCNYTSARITTQHRFEPKYGRIEARMKVPSGTGYWTAFWMMGANVDTVGWPASGEADILEQLGNHPSRSDAAIHGPSYRWGSKFETGETLSNGYHTYRMDWSADAIQWFIDGRLYGTQRRSEHTATQWAFDHSFFLVLNVALPSGPPAAPIPSTRFPQALSVDYVAVYQQES